MSDVCIDSCDDIDTLYNQPPFEWKSTNLWNGREVNLFIIQEKNEKILGIIHSDRILEANSLKDRNIEQIFLDDTENEEQIFEDILAENNYEFDSETKNVDECKSLKAHIRRAGKEIKKGLEKTGKALKKLAKKTADLIKKAADAVAHGTKKAAENVVDFVKDHKKETLIAVAVLAAIAGAFIISGALSGGAAAAAASGAAGGGGAKKRENEEDDKDPSPPPPSSNPPPLPDWVSELLKSTSHEFSPGNTSEASIADAKKEAHDAWDLFNHLKLETENNLASLKKHEPQFNPSSKAAETILDTVLNQAQKFEASKTFITSQSWSEIIQSGHEKIDQAFNALSAHNQAAVPMLPPQKTTFLEKIQMGLEIIGRGMCEPELLDPNSPIDPFFKTEDAPKGQTIANFFETIEATLKSGWETMSNEMSSHPNSSLELSNVPAPLEQSLQHSEPDKLSFFQSTITPVLKTLGGLAFIHEPLSSLAALSKPQASRYFETDGVKRDDMLITFINGMGNNFEDANRNLGHLKKLSASDLRIEGIYNHSNGPIADPAEIFFLNYFGISPKTQHLLAQKWIEFHEKNKDNPDAKILHFCHSQGSIHTMNTLMMLPEEIRDRVIVVSIAPAKIVPDELCYRSFKYASRKDIVHLGEDIMVYAALAFVDNEVIRQEQLELHQKHKDQLILLEPHEDAEDIDHHFMSPTFDNILQQRFEDYFEGGYK